MAQGSDTGRVEAVVDPDPPRTRDARSPGSAVARDGDERGGGGSGLLEDVESPPLRVEGVTVRYGSTVAVSEATFEAYPGEFIAVTGHSGAGTGPYVIRSATPKRLILRSP